MNTPVLTALEVKTCKELATLPLSDSKIAMKFVEFSVKQTRVRGNTRWVVDLRRIHQGRQYFTDEKLAIDYARAKAEEIRDYGVTANSLTYREQLEFSILRDRLKELGLSTVEALRFLAANYRKQHHKTLDEAKAEFIKGRTEAGVSDTYAHQLKVWDRVFLKGSMSVRTIGTPEIELWLESKAGQWKSKSTRNTYLMLASTFFNFCQSRGYIDSNPVKPIPKSQVNEKTISRHIFNVAQVKLLLDKVKQDQPDLLAHVVLGLFCGIRVSEIMDFSWSNVNLKEKFVVVEADGAKTRRRRLVQLSDNAVEWLKLGGTLPSHDPTDRLVLLWSKLKEKQGWKPWPRNVLRHCFATYHLALHGDAGLTATEMGHHNTDMLHRHYKALANKAEAKRYWSLRP